MEGVVYLCYRSPLIKSAVSLHLALHNIFWPDLISTVSFVTKDSLVRK